MSDFDKEAEREKLREKYERDKEERQATQRMSDLLLKGATMTNAHCGTCGDPLFQQNDTTFCPSCHGNPDAVEGTDLEAQPAEESPDSGGTAQSGDAESARASAGDADSAGSEQAASRDERSRSTREPDQPATGDAPADTAADSTTPSRDGRTPSAQSESSAPPQSESPPSASDADDSRRSSSDGRVSGEPSAARPAGDLETAHASLVQALEKFAAKAADTDDPRYAKECLEAAREASETLETLR